MDSKFIHKENLVNVPSGMDLSCLEPSMVDMVALAEARAELNGGPIELCGWARRWEECFTIWMKKEGTFSLVFWFNVGPATLAVDMEVRV